MPRLWAVVAIALAASAVTSAAVAADGKTLRLNWVDTTPSYKPAMTFKVASVTLTPKAWSVHATIVNRSKAPAQVVRPDPRMYPSQYGFSLLWAGPCPPPSIGCRLAELQPTYSKPPLPTTLAAGKSWTGVFGGPGLPPKGKLVWIGFGYFVFRADGKTVGWVTSSAFKR